MGFKRADFPLLFLCNVGKPLQKSVSLQGYSNLRIGGWADYFFEASFILELVKSIRLARQYSIPYYIIGGGCNLLFDDNGFHGLIVKNAVKGIVRKGKEGEIEALSGTPLRDLLQFSTEEGLSGFEFLSGIPGTVGGAVFSNAGAFGKSIGSILKEAVLLNKEGKEVKVKKEYFKFSYRHSVLREKHDVLLKTLFVLQEGDRMEIEARIRENLEKRKKRQPPEDAACAGSYFKNPILPDGRKVPAGFLLEQVGAKNLKIGDATVDAAHANFIINQEKASSRDVLRLAQELKRRVKEKFGIELEEEVIFLQASSSMS